MDWTSTELSFKPAQTKEQILASIAGALLSQLPDQTALEQAPDCKGTLNTKGILGTEGTLGTPTSILSSSTAANAAGRDPPQRAKQDSDTRLEDTNSINPITPTAMQPHDASPLNAYPTEDRIRQKALEKVRKEMGVKAVKRVKHVEDHHDDCGESLEGLPPCPDQEDCHLADYAVDDDFDHTAHRVCYQCCELFASAPREPCNLQWAFQTLDCASGGIDVMEVCGGEGRPSYVAVRRQLSVGEHIDLIAGWDINDPAHQHAVIEYVQRHRPLLIIMGPSCTPWGPWRHLNKVINPDAYLRAVRQAKPHGLFCAELCWLQLDASRYFWAEQPWNSALFSFGQWPELLAHPAAFMAHFDQCMLGLVDSHGIPLKKPSACVTNAEVLYQLFNKIRCDGSHMHGKVTKQAQVYPWRLANLLIDGLIQLKMKLNCAYPASSSAASSAAAAPARDDDPLSVYNRECVACKCHWPKGDPAHTRVPGKCRFPLDADEQWDCPGCIKHRPLTHPDHTYDPLTCRATVAWGRRGRPRQGSHPRQPAAKASDSEVRDLQAQLPLGQGDLGAQEEQQVADAATASGSGGPGGRTAVRDASTGTPVISDWTRFNVQSSLAVLRTGTAAMKLRMLRKLHLRWWHASAHTMSHVLSSAGVGPQVLELLPQVVDTCRQCLEWARLGTRLMPCGRQAR